MDKEDTFGRLLLDDALPPDVPRPGTGLDKKTATALFEALAAAHPDKYREVAKRITDLGAEAGTLTGGLSFGPEHLRSTPEVEKARERFRAEIRAVLSDRSLSDQQRNQKLIHLGLAHSQPITDAVKASTATNPLVGQVTSGAKGKMDNVKSLMAGDTLYVDSAYKPIPFPIVSSFYEGLRPHEFAAGTFGARTALILTKLGTAMGGYACLREGTRVRMADGSGRAIETVRPGDEVSGADARGRSFPVRVTGAFDNGVRPVRRYVFLRYTSEDEVAVEATADHKCLFRVGADYRILPLGHPDAQVLVVNDYFEPHEYIRVSDEPIGDYPTYDIEVDHPDHLFLLDNGAVVSNSKRIRAMTHRLVVTAPDADKTNPDDPLTGLRAPLTDPDNEGSLLARDTGGFKRNTVLTRSVIADLKRQGVQDVYVRSPMVGGPPDGGVYGYDVGVRERGGIAPVADQVGLAAGDALCLAQGTMVRMADGTEKAIENVVPGDVVFGSDANGVLRPVRVLNRYDNGTRKCYRTRFSEYSLRSSVDIVSTLEHRILTIKDRGPEKRASARHVVDVKPLAEVRPKGKIYAKGAAGFDDGFGIEEPYALMLGLLLGNGCYTGRISSNGVMLSAHDQTLVADIESYVESLGLRLVPQTAVGEYRVSDVKGGKARKNEALEGPRNGARRKLLELGMWGKYAHDKVIPDVVHGWNNKSVAALLSGLFATDGSVCPGPAGSYVVHFGSTSRIMVEQLRYLLMVRFGIMSSGVSEYRKPKDGDDFYRPQFATVVGSWDNFQKLAGVLRIPGVKGKQLHDAAESWKRGSRARYMGRLRCTGQEYVGELPTYDIEVDHPDHLFLLANGLITHNSEPMTQSIIGCLRGGTAVRMADWSVKPIEEIRIGDEVSGVEILHDGTPCVRPATVTHTFVQGRKPCRRYAFAFPGGDVEIQCTPDHKIMGDTWETAWQLPASGYESSGRARAYRYDEDRWVRSTKTRAEDAGVGETYDIEIDNVSSLFLLANGMVVSNSKHTGGVAGSTGAQEGFPVLDKLISIPGDYGGAVHAETDGVLSAVRDAPQGGKFVTVNGVDHYVPSDRSITAKHGQHIEAGDPLTDGLENPAKYVEHKGIGEARRRFVSAFMRASESAGFRPNRRNLELVARGYLDHVEIGQEHGEHVPGDVVSYTALAHGYEPRPGHKWLAPADAENMYLERPALHYTIGTKVRPSVIRDLRDAGVARVPVHADPPPFTPIAIRSHDVLSYDPDVMTRMLGSGLERGLLKGVARGQTTELGGTSWVGSLSEGSSFAKPDNKTRSWNPGDVIPPGAT